ncbi:MAG: internalization-related competence protein ComEC/Rec2, competence protein ComEC protein [Candidatus Nomurabacteria bacterium]|nr:internalization-related competence protein ComEC/Rec2, competence protein ComEC protein [Candidatus Nomurabacteria bacterium]
MVFGAILYRSLHISLMAIGMISALTSAFFFIYFLNKRVILIGLVICCGALRMSFDSDKVSQEFFTQKEISGMVQSVDRRLDKTLVTVKEVQSGKTIQVSLHSKTAALPGDTVSVFGQLEKPKDFLTDTGRTFEYQNYLRSKGIVAIVSNGSVHVSALGRFSLNRLATIVRFHIALTFSKYVSFPTDGMVSGMIVGYQGSLPDWLSNLFRTTGVLHVLVLSGENIVILATFLAVVLKPVPFKLRTIITALAIIMIVLISGAGVAAVRSGIMGSIALAAGLLKRGYVPLRALTISMLFFFFYSPSTLFIDPGFHLSVLATMFMILILPKAKKAFAFLPERFNAKEILILAICMPLFMLPYTMYFSGLEPLASAPANILMVFVTPLVMLLGTIILFVSWVPPIATLLGGLLSFVGTATIALLKLLDTLPQLNTPPVEWWGVLVAYGIFFIVVLRKEIRLHSSSFVQGSR